MRKWEWNGKSDCDWIVSSLVLNVIKQTSQISLSKLYAYRDFVSIFQIVFPTPSFLWNSLRPPKNIAPSILSEPMDQFLRYLRSDILKGMFNQS